MDADPNKQATEEILIRNNVVCIQGLFIRVRVHSKLNFDLIFLHCCDKLLGLYTQDVIVCMKNRQIQTP